MPSLTAYSAEKIQRQRLKPGDKAQFAGVLLSDAALAKLISDSKARLASAQATTEKCERERKVEKAAADAVCVAKVEAERTKLLACDQARSQQAKIYDQQLKQCSSTPWFKSPLLNFVLGSVVSGGVCATAAILGRR